MFEERYRELIARERYAPIRGRFSADVSKIHNGYFSQDRKGRLKDTKGDTQADDDTYNTIMLNMSLFAGVVYEENHRAGIYHIEREARMTEVENPYRKLPDLVAMPSLSTASAISDWTGRNTTHKRSSIPPSCWQTWTATPSRWSTAFMTTSFTTAVLKPHQKV